MTWYMIQVVDSVTGKPVRVVAYNPISFISQDWYFETLGL